MMRDVLVGLGSNVGDRLEMLRSALEAIEELDTTRVIAVSAVYETEPWGVADQPRFANAVARIDTDIPADRLLEALQETERLLGRRPGPRYGPRPIDLDILLYGDDEWETPDLMIPHPRLAEREFVVRPLLSIAPDATWPDGSPITDASATEGRVLSVLGPVPGFERITPPIDGWPEAVGTAEGAVPQGWVTVASERFGMGKGAAFAVELLYDAALLEAEGIAIGWDPMPPGEEYSPWALPRTYRLLVAHADAGQARRILDEAHAAGAVFLAEEERGPGVG